LASTAAARATTDAPWKSLGLGFAMFAATPLVILLLLITLVGIWLALVLMALLPVLLFIGFLTGAIAIGDLGLRRVMKGKKPARVTKGQRVLSIVAALVALWLIGFIPVLGPLACFAVLLFGAGGLTLFLWDRYAGAR
jgi:hypothetical protein